MISVRRRFARDAAILSTQAIVQRILGMATSIVLARGLGAAGLGVLNAIQSTAENAYGLGRLGVDVATHVHLAEADAEPDRKGRIVAAAAVVMAVSAVVWAAVCWLAAGWIATHVFGQPELTGWLRFAGLLVLAQFGNKFGYAAMAGLHAFGRYARVSIATAALMLVATVGGVLAAGLAGAVAATVAAMAAGAAWLGWEVRGRLQAAGIPISLERWRTSISDLVRLGGPFYLTGLVLIPVAYGLQGLLAGTGGIEQMGYLRVMLSIGGIIAFLPGSLAGAAISSLTALRSDPDQQPGAYARHVALNLRLIWLFCLIVVLALAVVLGPIIRLLFGDAYVAAVPAYRWGLFGAMLLAVEGVVTQALLAGRRVWLLSALMIGRALVWVALGLLLVPTAATFGYLAADAISLALFVPAGVIALMAPLMRDGADVRDGVRLALLALLTAAAGAAVLPAWPADVRTAATAAMLVLVALAGLMGVLDADERSALAALSRWRPGRS